MLGNSVENVYVFHVVQQRSISNDKALQFVSYPQCMNVTGFSKILGLMEKYVVF